MGVDRTYVPSDRAVAQALRKSCDTVQEHLASLT